jgi:hypothetical protein
VEGPYRIDALAFGPLQGFTPLRSELAHQGWLWQGDDLLQGGDTETFQAVNDERIHRQYGDGTGGKEGGKH